MLKNSSLPAHILRYKI